MTDFQAIDLQLTDPQTFAGEDYHEIFTTLRREDPVHWTTGNYSRGFWSVTRHEDVLDMLDQPEVFSSSAGTHLPPDGRDLSEEERYRLGYDVQLVTSDPPIHNTKRRPFNKHFSVPAVKRFHDDCDRIVDAILDDAEAKGEVDLVKDIAALLPVNLFLNLMGVPEEDWEHLRGITITMLHPQDAEYLEDGVDPTQAIIQASDALYKYAYEHTMKRRGYEDQYDDFASLIANLKVEGEYLDERDAAWMSFSVIAGGLETTRNAAAVGILELMRNPDQAALLQDDKIAKNAVEEIIRWVTPSKNRLRVAMQDTTLGGKEIKKGDWVVGWGVSANRDEEVFENPQTFNILREHNPHLGFGDGEHLCLGRNVARLELQVLIQRLFARFPDVAPISEAEWVASDNTTGLKRLQIRVQPKIPSVVGS
ncbi:cytochrome P450 [Corynebacterium suranareeae]|uniref:Cytochrome P450 n=1 Tax=Corynebacterium suranareeae TaxID=2506452 RepID=A0A160PP99_9CORY|nr:cytochrome P450 [Corynebacterium suranareeae]BAU94421.1 cytochrome P450 [Corynebacterium suranareeae]